LFSIAAIEITKSKVVSCPPANRHSPLISQSGSLSQRFEVAQLFGRLVGDAAALVGAAALTLAYRQPPKSAGG